MSSTLPLGQPAPRLPGEGLERALILVKAVPRPSKTYQETVCCAGVTDKGEWRRLYPIRFRQLQGAQQFNRWQWVEYGARMPRADRRQESRRIEEQTLRCLSKIKDADRLRQVFPLLRRSTKEAAGRGESLCLLEPRTLALKTKLKPPGMIEEERRRYKAAAAQPSFLDRELGKLEPCPYAVQMPFVDEDGASHTPMCGDWETTATFFNLRRQGHSDSKIIEHLTRSYTSKGPKKRVFLAMGTVAARPRQWLLLGVLRVSIADPNEGGQGSLAL